jgi:dephospho-CoA kinase
MRPAPLIGLTGGIGSGKSTVAALLAELGAVVIDADRIGHEAYRAGTGGFERVVDAFGRGILAADGTIDRRALGALVFSDSAALARLNALVHPLIADEIRRRIAAARDEAPERPIVVEAAIMLEAGWHFFDHIWLVSVDRETAVRRLTATRGLTREEVERRIAAQMPEAERRQRADTIIDNSGTLIALRERVEAAWHALVG